MTSTFIFGALVSAFVGLVVRDHYTLKIQAIRREYEAMLDAAAEVIADTRPPLIKEETLTIPPRVVDWPKFIEIEEKR